MDFRPTEEQELMVQAIEDAMNRENLETYFQDCDKNHEHPKKWWDILDELGLFSMFLPEEAGGDGEGAVTGVSIVDNAETAGIGSKVMENQNGVLDQFIGKSAADGTLAVGTNVDAITGATVSSKGVTAGVNAALAVAGAIGWERGSYL